MTNENHLANFAEWNPYPIVELDSEGKVVYVNLIARTQFPDLSVQGLEHPLLLDLKTQISDFQLLKQREFTVFNRELTFNQRCYELQVFGLPDSNIFVFIVDVTERNQLKTEAHFNDKLASLGMLAAGVAHEIRNPITWILGNLSLLQKYAVELKSLTPDLRVINFIDQMNELIGESLDGMERIRDIAESLKGLARQDTVKNIPVDMHKVLNMVISMAALQFKKNIIFEKNYADNIPLLLSNSGKLHQVFLNLIINAAQSIKDDNKQHKVVISTYVEGERLRVDITDSGKGIAPGLLRRIFEPFFTTKGVGKGTGLGLSICREIIQDLQGEITVKSKEGDGSTFTVYLPVESKDGVQKESLAAPALAPDQKHILVVDDEPILVKLLKRILEGKHKVTTAKTGVEAKELLAKNPDQYDVIFTDLNMPEVSGADLYHLVAKQAPGLENRFIFITGGTSMSWVKDFLAGIDNPVLEKPFFPDEVLKLVDKVPNSTNGRHISSTE